MDDIRKTATEIVRIKTANESGALRETTSAYNSVTVTVTVFVFAFHISRENTFDLIDVASSPPFLTPFSRVHFRSQKTNAHN